MTADRNFDMIMQINWKIMSLMSGIFKDIYLQGHFKGFDALLIKGCEQKYFP